MFGNRSFNIKVVKDPKVKTVIDHETSSTDAFKNVELAAAYADVAKDLITHAAVTIGVVYSACKIISRICK